MKSGFNFNQFGSKKLSAADQERLDDKRARLPLHPPIDNWYAKATGRGRPGGGRSTLYYLTTRPVYWRLKKGVPMLLPGWKKGSGPYRPDPQILPFVSSVSYTKRPQITPVMTFGTVPARQVRYRMLYDISISGMAPTMDHPGINIMPSGGGKAKKVSGPQTGVEILDSLIEFVDNYTRALGRMGKGTKRYYRSTNTELMIFHAPYENLNLFVEPLSLNYSRSKSGSHFGYTYDINFMAWGEGLWASPEYALDIEQQELSFLETMQQAIAQGADIANRAESMVVGNLMQAQHIYMNAVVGSTQALSTAVTDLTSGVVGAVTGIIGSLDVACKNFKTAFGNLVPQVAYAYGIPTWWNNPILDKAERSYREGTEGYRAVQTSQQLVYQKASQSPTLTKNYKDFVDKIPYPFWTTQALDFNFGSMPGYVPPPDAETEPTEVYVAKDGDTFQSIALEQLGSVDMWPVLMLLNGGTEADFLAGHKPLHMGAKVIVPTSNFSAALGSSPTDDPYLTDYLLADDGDLVAVNDEFNDVKIVTGPLCLKQGLQHRLSMRTGDSLVFPDNGLAFGAGDNISMETSVFISEDVKNQILSDPRIIEYKLLELIDVGHAIEVNSQATAISGASISLTVPVNS